MKRAAGSLLRSFGTLHLAVKSNLREESRSWSTNIKLGVHYSCSQYATKASVVRSQHSVYSGIVQDQAEKHHGSRTIMRSEQEDQTDDHNPLEPVHKREIGQSLPAVEKRKFLMNTLFDLKDSKEAVYGTLDAWVAWEQNFPLASLKRALIVLEKEEQWHRVVQVIKWMLSKGQGTTMGTYEQLIRALEKDNRAEEAHRMWVKKIGHDLHSVPWRFCDLMISIYYRNNMLNRLVKLFGELESYGRIPPSKSIVQKVADAYEMLDLLEEKNKVLDKYNNLFCESSKEKKSQKDSQKNGQKSGKRKHTKKKAVEPVPMDSGSSDEEFATAI